MKTLSIIFLLICAPIVAQEKMNPDGYIGGLTFNLGTAYHTESIADKPAVKLDAEVKIPISQAFTVSLYYQKLNVDYKNYKIFNSIFRNDSDTFGLKISLYMKNIF